MLINHFEKSSELFRVDFDHVIVISNNAGQNLKHKLYKTLLLKTALRIQVSTDQTSLNIFAEPLTLAHCVLLIWTWMNSHKKGFAFSLIVHLNDPEIFQMIWNLQGALPWPLCQQSWTCSFSWSLKPHSGYGSKHLPEFSCSCSTPPGKLFLSALWDLDSSAATRCILVLETSGTELIWWLGCESRTGFAYLTTDSPWYSYAHHTSLVSSCPATRWPRHLILRLPL